MGVRTERIVVWRGWTRVIHKFGWGNVRVRKECVGVWRGWGWGIYMFGWGNVRIRT